MGGLRIAAGESFTRIADCIYVAAAARAAEGKGGRGRFGAQPRSPQPKRRCSTVARLLSKQRLGIAAEAAGSAQRGAAGHAGGAGVSIVRWGGGGVFFGPPGPPN